MNIQMSALISEGFGLFLLVFTSLVGTFTLVRMLGEKLMGDASEEDVISLVPVKGHAEQIEYLLRALCLKERCRVVVADCGMDSETREIVLRMKAEQANVSLLNPEELNSYFQENGRLFSGDLV